VVSALWGVAGCGEGGGGAARVGVGDGALDAVPIHRIQGAGHRSPLEGEWVAGVRGVVTASTAWGFYLQAPVDAWDDDDATSEGVFVFTGEHPGVDVGDGVAVDGRVREVVPGGEATGNLPTTELHADGVAVWATDQPLPPPVVLGAGGRLPPTGLIAGDGSPFDDASFDPSRHGLDFFESLEAMRVEVRQAVAVGPTRASGEIPVVGDRGAHATRRTHRGGLYVGPDDLNPERIHVDGRWTAGVPVVAVGDHFDGPVVGVVGYTYGRFRVYLTDPWPEVAPVGPGPEAGTSLAGGCARLTLASLNAEGVHPGDGRRAQGLADAIVRKLRSPDVVALQEVQDDNGSARGALSAGASFAALIDAIVAAGGPRYAHVDIAPHAEDADGGPPGANIRVGYLWRPERVGFEPRGAPGPLDAVGVGSDPDGRPRLEPNPGRIEPDHGVWTRSRKPLVAELTFQGRRLFVINVHLRARIGDAPPFGAVQPPPLPTEAQRRGQARVIARWVQSLLDAHPEARVVVLGDFNAFDWSPALSVLGEAGLHNLMAELPLPDRYTYVHHGSSQALDHILVSEALAGGAEVDAVHIHAELPWSTRASDHDPVVARLRVR
jgi:uncharacterized protein